MVGEMLKLVFYAVLFGYYVARRNAVLAPGA
jgi:hypothetical protein